MKELGRARSRGLFTRREERQRDLWRLSSKGVGEPW